MALKKSLIPLVLIVLLGLLAYSNTFGVPFVFDDQSNIVENPLIKDFKYILEPSRAKEAVMGYDILNFGNRIVGYLTFALNWRAHGLDVRGYHIANLAIHIVNALLVYWLVVLTFRTPFMSENPPPPPFAKGGLFSGNSRYIALFSALLFVAHPVQTQAVTYIVQRFASLATLFYLLSLAAYVRARLAERNAPRYAFYVLSLLSAVLAMKTKEIAFTLPVVIALYEFLFFRDTPRRRFLYLVPLLLTMLIIPITILGTGRPLGEFIGEVGEATRLETGMSRLDYLLTESRVMVTYIRLLFLPINQNLDYDYPVYNSFLNPNVFLSFLFLVSIVGLGVFLLRRSRSSEPALRLVSFGIFWFFITLSVESSLVPIEDVIFEHRLYLPSVGVAIAVATGAALMIERLGSKRFRIAATVVLAMVPLVLAGAAYKRNTVWHSGLTLWSDVVKKAPGNARAHNNLGFAWFSSGGRPDRAVEHFKISLSLAPEAKTYLNISAAYKAMGQIDKAMEHLRSAIRMSPGHAKAYNNLGVIYYYNLGQPERAIEQYRIALSLEPQNARTHLNIGVAYRAKGLNAKATHHIRVARSLNPELFRGKPPAHK